MSDREEVQSVLEKMRRNWDRRAAENAEYYVCTQGLKGDEFDASGKINFDQLVRPCLPVLLKGRPAKECRVVEIGCGLGRMTQWFAREFLEVHGVDVSPEMISQAAGRLRSYPNASFHVGSGMDLACLQDNYFDLAFSFIVFQHIPSSQIIENYIREAARVLKPDGAFYFQLNGYQSPDYHKDEGDSWLGESFSLAEAAEMLVSAGFHPFSASGAGKQYFLLMARREADAQRRLSPFILPGSGWPAAQLLEGWRREIAGDCRPIESPCRTRLGIPPGQPLCLYLAVDCGAASLRKLKAMVEEQLIGTAEIPTTGDYYFEWPLPASLCQANSIAVTLVCEPPQPVSCSVRSLGIYHPAGAFQETSGHAGPHEESAVPGRLLWECNSWIATLEQECARLSASSLEAQADRHQIALWAKSLEADLERCREALAQSQQALSQSQGELQHLQTFLRHAAKAFWQAFRSRLSSRK